jgi:hypothetical protein
LATKQKVEDKQMDKFRAIFEFLGYLSTIIVVISLIYGAITWFRGILPAIFRLGKGLAKRKVAIFARGDRLNSLKNLPMDSKLFNKKNLIEISSTSDIGRSEDATVFLVFWHDWQEDIDQILAKKKDKNALIVYAPQKLGFVSTEQMERINEVRNASVTNFRGRLLSDIVISMITTSYD